MIKWLKARKKGSNKFKERKNERKAIKTIKLKRKEKRTKENRMTK